MKLADYYKKMPLPAKAALWYLVCGILQRGVSVIVTPIFSRLLSTEEYGQYTLFNSWLDILSILLTLRLSFGVFMQGLVRYDNDKDEYTSALQALTTVLVLVGLVIYLSLQEFFNSLTGLNTALMLCVFASAWASAMFGFWSTRQRVEYRYKALVILTMTVAIIQPCAGIISVLCFKAHRVEARVISMAVVQLCFFGWMFFYYLRKSRRFFHRGYWVHALKFNIPLIPHYLSHSLLNQSDRIMISQMIGKSAAGIYGLAYSLSWTMNIVNQALVNTINPWIYQHIKTKEFDSIAKVSYLAMIGVCAANLCLIALAPEAISFFAPPAYHDGIWLVPPLAGAVVIMFMYSLFADFEFYYEKTGYVMLASVVGAFVNIILNYLFLPTMGYQIAAWTTLIGYIVYVGMHYYFMRRIQIEQLEGIRVYNPLVLLGIILAFSVCAIILVLLYPYPIVRYAGVVLLLLLCFINREQLLSLYLELKKK